MAIAKKGGREVATRKTTAVVDSKVPAYLQKGGGGRGNEAVSLQDVVIPRLEVVQALSPCLKKSDPAFIAGIEAGELFNSVTRENYGQTVDLIPVVFKKQYLVWRDRDAGGGFRGAFDTAAEAAARIKEEAKPAEFEAVETAQQLCLIVKQDGTTEEIVVSMAKTKLKVSRQWNSLIRLTSGSQDRFSRVYQIFGVEDSSDKGDFFNLGVQLRSDDPFPTEPQFLAAEKLYEAIVSGQRQMKVDDSQEGGSAPTSKDY